MVHISLRLRAINPYGVHQCHLVPRVGMAFYLVTKTNHCGYPIRCHMDLRAFTHQLGVHHLYTQSTHQIYTLKKWTESEHVSVAYWSTRCHLVWGGFRSRLGQGIFFWTVPIQIFGHRYSWVIAQLLRCFVFKTQVMGSNQASYPELYALASPL